LVSSPVTAQLIMTSWFMRLSLGRAEWRQAASGYIIVMIIFKENQGNCAASTAQRRMLVAAAGKRPDDLGFAADPQNAAVLGQQHRMAG